MDVANNNTRGSSQRLRDKKERITQRSVHSLRDALRSSQQLKERLQAAEQKAAAGDVRIRTTRDEESVSVCVCVCACACVKGILKFSYMLTAP